MLLNEQLWSIYQMAAKRDLIRGLVLYELEEDTELSYKFLMISPNPSSFFMDTNWLMEIDEVNHIEKEYLFAENGSRYFNFYIVFKTGWRAHFIVIECGIIRSLLNVSKLMIFIDRDEFIDSSESLTDILSYEMILNEAQFKELALEFYENALLQAHYFKFASVNQLSSSSMKSIILQLLTGLCCLKSSLLEEDYERIQQVIDFMKKYKGNLEFKDFLVQFKLGNRLFEGYSNLLNYSLSFSQLELLKEYLNSLLNEMTCNKS